MLRELHLPVLFEGSGGGNKSTSQVSVVEVTPEVLESLFSQPSNQRRSRDSSVLLFKVVYFLLSVTFFL